MGFEGIPPGQILPYLLSKLGVGEPFLPGVQAQPPGFSVDYGPYPQLNTPFVNDTLSQLFSGPHTLTDQWQVDSTKIPLGIAGSVAASDPRSVFLNPLHEAVRRRTGEEADTEFTLSHEMVHTDQFTNPSPFLGPERRTSFLPEEVEQEVHKAVAAASEKESDRFMMSKEPMAYAVSNAIKLLRVQDVTPAMIEDAESVYPGTKVVFEYLKKVIK